MRGPGARNVRDFILLAALLILTPLALRAPIVGLLGWLWIGLMMPHREVYGFFAGAGLNFFIAILTVAAWLFSRERKTMPADLASRTWLFAETLAKAAEVFGGREDAERWMSGEAMGLDGARPIELMRTVQGAELVNEFLLRLEHGVYT